LALAVGTLGHISALRRMKVGPFSMENAISLDKLEAKVQEVGAAEFLLPVMTALADIPALAISEAESQRLRLGQTRSFVPKSEWPRLAVLPDAALQGQVPLVAVCNGQAVAMAELSAGELRVVRGLLH